MHQKLKCDHLFFYPASVSLLASNIISYLDTASQNKNRPGVLNKILKVGGGTKYKVAILKIRDTVKISLSYIYIYPYTQINLL